MERELTKLEQKQKIGQEDEIVRPESESKEFEEKQEVILDIDPEKLKLDIHKMGDV